MNKSSILFRHPILAKESSAVAKRRETLLASVPRIEAYYAKATASKAIQKLDIKPATSKAALRFYNEVVTDGRFIGQLATDPQAVAEKLKIKVTPVVINAISAVTPGLLGPGPAEGPVEAVI